MEPIYGGNLGRQIMVFKPTMDEFKNFSGYIEYMESMGAHKAGIAKIIPPREWVPRRMGYDDIDMLIKAPIEQSVQGIKGLYTQYNIQRKAMTVKEFAAMAKSSKYAPPAGANFEELERKYWRNITFNPPYYGADVSGTLTDPDQPYWNIGKLGTILDCLTDEYKVKIEGVNTAYLYFGMWKATFPWHTEDMDLYSINYIHFGAPKSWYAVPPEHGRRLERLATSFFPASAATCKAFLRHKMNIISPSILHQYSVPVNKITQEAGQFIVTFPYGYHAGYNHGYNAAESTNFASERWIEYGKRCSRCVCNRDSVRIKMDVFVKRYQPDRYDAWLAGTDVGPHPEDDTSKLYPTRHQTSTAAAADADSRKRKIAVNEEGCMSTKRHPPASSFTTSVPAPANMKQARVIIRPLSVSDLTSGTAAKLAGQVVRSVSRNSQSTADDEIEEILPNYHVPLEERVKMRHTKAPFIVLKPMMQHETSSPASIVTLSDSSDSSVDQQVANRKAAKSKACRCRGGYVDGPACCSSTDERSQSPSLAEVDVRCCAENNGQTTVTKTCSHNPCNACCVDNGTSSLLPSKTFTTTAYTTSHANVLQALNACLKREQARQQYPSLTCTPSSADNSVMADGNAVTESTITQSLDAERQAVTSYLSASTNQMPLKLSASLPSVISHSVQLDTGNSAAVPLNDLSLFDCYQTADGQLVFVPKTNISNNKLTVEHDSPLINGASNGHLSYDLNGQLYVSSSVEEVMCDSVPVVCDEVIVDSAGDTHPAGTDDLLYKGLRPLGQGQAPIGDAENECEGRMSQQHRTGVEQGLYSRKQTANKRKKQASSGMLSAVVKSSLGELRIDKKRMARCSEELRTLVLGDGEEEIAAYNRRYALAPPHCAVCSLFTPPAQRCVPTSSPPLPLPASSRPVANHLCFATSSAMLPEEVGSCVGMDATGASCLLTCQQCAMCVHASCYGSSACAENWLCDACIASHIGRELPRPRCCLCVMRGGPLKCTSDGRWAHITCVIGLPDVSFVNIATRQPVCIDNIDPARTTLRCCYCHQVSGVCVQCSQKKCFSSFHVTCGALSGVTFETWDWPYPVYITCHRHAAHSSQQAANKQDPLPVGCKVVAKQKNGLYSHAVVTGVTTSTCCNIDFEDGTYSNNMRLEDIESHNIVRDGAPESGTIVQARWVDGLLYSATFNSITDVITYKVQFADSGAQLSVRHEDTWPAKLPLPVQVQAKLAQSLS